MTLQRYRKKRDFSLTPEPSGKQRSAAAAHPQFVIQKHDASRLHYDFRLELDGVLKSWASPKGPSLDPGEKSLAVEVEDHPLEYASFEGVIPQGQYGGGTVMVWDRGAWRPEGDPLKGLVKGKLTFHLDGEKLHGAWTLVRMRGKAGEGGKNWLLIKKKDDAARPGDEYALLERSNRSVLSGRELSEIAKDRDRVWNGEQNGSDEPTRSSSLDPSSIRGAAKRRVPTSFKPQLATLVSETPTGDDWLHELKFDGYRLLARCDGDVRLVTRRGEDWSDRFPTIADALDELDLHGTLLDGEAVVLDTHGVSDFQALQNVMNSGRDKDVVYYVFDAPFLAGYDLTKAPQTQRKEAVRRLLVGQPADGVVRYCDHIEGHGGDVVEHACRHALEGVISKKADAPYQQRRSRTWVKVKCLKRQEFVIGGWTDPSGSRTGFGALLLGTYSGEELRFNGRVGTGFNDRSLREVHEKLKSVSAGRPAFANPPRGADARGVHWVKPRLVAEVEFTEWTDDDALRHPSFKGLREDKAPESIVREAPQNSQSKRPSMPHRQRPNGDAVAGVRITHPDRVVYPEQGVTKRDLAEYYDEMADWILPYAADRPLTVVRCPQGRGKKCFFQKHVTDSLPSAVGSVEVEEDDGIAEYVTIADRSGLVALVQMNVLEFHPWGSRNDMLDKPDLLVFDLDPGEGAPWRLVVDGARELRDRLKQAGLESYLRTTGGKGLHVVAPLTRRNTWDEAKSFAKAIAQAMAHDTPKHYVATSSKAKRKNKVYVDYLRNSRGATAVCSHSTRARAGAPLATPLTWDELSSKLRSDAYTLKNIRKRLSSLSTDPWEGFFKERQSLTKRALSTARAGDNE